MTVIGRLRNTFRRARVAADVDDELRFDFDMRRADYIAKGLSVADAESRARRETGSPTYVREVMQAAHLIPWIETLLQDLRLGLRQLRRRSLLSLITIATLALGMGATTAIFSVADAALLRPLPYPRADRIVAVNERGRDGFLSPTIPEFLDFKGANHSLDDMAFFDSRDFQISGSDEPQRVFAARVTAEFFPLLGARPALGRFFEATETAHGTSDAVVLSYALWQRAFGADPAVLGRRVSVNGLRSTVIGVMAADFSVDYASLSFPEPIDLYVPYPMTPIYLSRSGPDSAARRVTVLARLTPSATLESTRADLQIVADRLTHDYPNLYRGMNGERLPLVVAVRPLRDAILGRDRTALNLLMGAMAFVLLLACANTVQTRLAQGLARHREFVLRAAIGAGRGRLIRQLLVENLVLVSAAAVSGVVVARIALSLLLAMRPSSPMTAAVVLNVRALVFMGGLLIITTLLCGLPPALSISRARSSLMLSVKTAAGDKSQEHLRGLLVVGQVALALVLLFGAGVLFRTLVTLRHSVEGFSPEGVLTMQMRMRYQRAVTFTIPGQPWQEIVDHVEHAPGVAAAGLTTALPPGGREFTFTVRGEATTVATRHIGRAVFVSPGFFAVLRIPLIAGRTFTAQDTPDRPRVAIISDDAARTLWPGRSAIGQTIDDGPSPLTVVGVVGVARVFGTATVPPPQIYLPVLYTPEPNMLMAVRAATGTTSVFPAVQAAVRRADRDQPIFRVRDMSDLLSDFESGPRTLAMLSGAFALLGLMLAGSGLYSAISFLVGQRVPEIAIRVTLGAGAMAVLRLVGSRLLAWTLAGLALGVAGAYAVSGFLRSLIVGDIRPADPFNLASTCGLFLLVIVFAAAVPLRRALTTDPAVVLRAE